ncbi:MAG: ribosome maturation factor RimM [Acidimicrobiia bacterium]
MVNDFLRIAKCGKPVGLKGEVVLWPISNLESRYVVGSILYVDEETSLEIENIRNHKDHFIVKFKGITDRNAAQELTNKVLLAPESDEDLESGEHYYHDCINKVLIDQDNVDRGKVISIIPNPASDLLELEDGNLVPMSFITEVNSTNVYAKVPEGLFEINDGK